MSRENENKVMTEGMLKLKKTPELGSNLCPFVVKTIPTSTE